TFVGDGNNVCHSLMLLAAKLGMNFTAATPKGYEPNKEVVKKAQKFAKASGAKIEVVNNPKEGVKKSDVVYTDVWASMGQESEKDERAKIFKEFQVNAKLMNLAKDSAIFMHCLPAHRGEQVTDEVMDGKQSRIFDEAENRLHTQKAILHTLMHGV
ncbi:MAG: ornithine carbamoyltransferase, partial [Ignavibacteriae bacterium]|nr:ornithine carbamoyltransferase [Ignavibacteriota bacterium]